MLIKMRENLHYGLYALIIVFIITIFLSWGAGGAEVFSTEGLAGKIGEKSVSLQDFEARVKKEVEFYQTRIGREMPEQQMDAFRKNVWTQMVNEYVINQELKKRHIEVTDSELVYATYNDPIPEVKQNQSFQENGSFSPSKLRELISQNTQLAFQLEYYFKTTYPSRIMEQFVNSAFIVSEADVLETYKSENLSANVRYLAALKSKIGNDSLTATDAEVESYFTEHKEDYKVEEKRKIEFIRFDVLPSTLDTTIVRDELVELKTKAINNEIDLGEEAKAVSEDRASADSLGVVNYFTHGTYTAEFDTLAFNTAIGQFFGPILIGDRFILAKVLDSRKNKEKKTTEIKIQQIVKFISTGTTTVDNFDQLVTTAQTAFKDGNSLKEFAEKNNQFYNETAFFTNTGSIPGIGNNGYLNDFIFNKSVGTISKDVRLNKSKTIFIVKILDNKDKGYQDLEELKPRLKNIIIGDKKSAKGKEILSSITDIKTSTFSEIAARPSLSNIIEADTTGSVNYYSAFVKGIGKSNDFIKFVANAKVGDFSNVILSNSGAFICEVISKKDFVQSEFESKRAEIKSRLENQSKYQQFSNWLTEASKNYTIEEYRLY